MLFSRSPDNRLFDIRQVLPTPDCPYPGMVPFSEAQQELFFGRDREIEEAVERLRQHPFLAVSRAIGQRQVVAGLRRRYPRAAPIPPLRARRVGDEDHAPQRQPHRRWQGCTAPSAGRAAGRFA